MGVYSNLAAQKVSEDAMIGSFSANSLLEFSISVQREEQAMFDAMIEMDFREAYYEHGMITLTEAEKEGGDKAAATGIIAKIKALLEKFIQTISLAIKKFLLKMQDFLKLNDKLVKNIGDLNVDDLKVAFASGKYADVKVTQVNSKKIDVAERLAKLRELEESTKKAIEGEKEKKGDAHYSDILDKLANDAKDLEITDKEFNEQFSEVHIIDLKPEYYKQIKDDVAKGYKSTVDEITKDVKKAIEDAKKAKKELKGDDRAYLSAMNAMYAKFIAAYTKLLNVAINTTVKALSAERATYAKLGAIAKKGKNDTEGRKNLAERNKKKEEFANSAAGKELAKDVADAQKFQGAGFGGAAQDESAMLEMFTIDMLNEEFMDSIFA